ncbi:hypothetical protein B0T17DRAFT_619301 [Bombardia bombarda]|uniref:Uncharacterized protein n=1 Tax=Bombardia bombarda TaxID=252184 RepID=A0AA40BW08_9PEZI|nr:hypothetical protein B0T17DRAFT_619301 [Bombardia bombarda]
MYATKKPSHLRVNTTLRRRAPHTLSPILPPTPRSPYDHLFEEAEIVSTSAANAYHAIYEAYAEMMDLPLNDKKDHTLAKLRRALDAIYAVRRWFGGLRPVVESWALVPQNMLYYLCEVNTDVEALVPVLAAAQECAERRAELLAEFRTKVDESSEVVDDLIWQVKHLLA